MKAGCGQSENGGGTKVQQAELNCEITRFEGWFYGRVRRGLARGKWPWSMTFSGRFGLRLGTAGFQERGLFLRRRLLFSR